MNAAETVALYVGADPKYIKGRIGAALIHMNDARLSAEQVAYWQAVADGCARLLAA
jgi:hypothetical protein